MATDTMMISNLPNISGWSLANGYINPYDEGNYPLQGVSTDAHRSLFIWAQTLLNDFENECKGIEQGFKVVLSTPGEALKMSENYFRISLSNMNMFYLTPEWITTTTELRHFQPNQRKCFYEDERRLRFFKMYTATNCETECMANFTKTICDCVKFSMPSMDLN
jgi:acid-sensing ion channel, other